jgi:Ser/Thr protein kinase RdoA (MazF antagonist)
MKLKPENQIKHSLESVKKLGRHYGIDVNGYQAATSGIENTTLIAVSNGAKYVFRIYRQDKKTDDQIHAEIDFIIFLRSHGVPTVDVRVNNNGDLLTNFEALEKSWQVIVMDFANGEHPKSLSTALITNIATTQAQMHTAAVNYTAKLDVIRQLTELVETEFIHQIDLATVNPELRAFLERGAAYKLALAANLPKGPCHMDYDEQNMLFSGDEITAVLDFDDMAVAPYVCCLAYTLWHIQDTNGVATRDSYLAVYQQLRPLSEVEKQFLFPAMLFRHYMISAIKVLAGKIDPKDIQDYLQVERQLQTSSLSN